MFDTVCWKWTIDYREAGDAMKAIAYEPDMHDLTQRLRSVRASLLANHRLGDIMSDYPVIVYVSHAERDRIHAGEFPGQLQPRSTGYYTMAELALRTGVTDRNIRFYITQGLIPPAIGRGPAARYTNDHVKALDRLTDAISANRSLADIKAEMTDAK